MSGQRAPSAPYVPQTDEPAAASTSDAASSPSSDQAPVLVQQRNGPVMQLTTTPPEAKETCWDVYKRVTYGGRVRMAATAAAIILALVGAIMMLANLGTDCPDGCNEREGESCRSVKGRHECFCPGALDDGRDACADKIFSSDAFYEGLVVFIVGALYLAVQIIIAWKCRAEPPQPRPVYLVPVSEESGH